MNSLRQIYINIYMQKINIEIRQWIPPNLATIWRHRIKLETHYICTKWVSTYRNILALMRANKCHQSHSKVLTVTNDNHHCQTTATRSWISMCSIKKHADQIAYKHAKLPQHGMCIHICILHQYITDMVYKGCIALQSVSPGYGHHVLIFAKKLGIKGLAKQSHRNIANWTIAATQQNQRPTTPAKK